MGKAVKEHDLHSEEQRSRPGPTAAELRELAERLRAIAKAIFQNGKLDIPFVKNEFATIFSPLVAGWYTRANALHDEEQKRLFEAVASLVKLRSGVAVDSPVERLKSIADDCDALAATLDPQPVTVEADGDSKPVVVLGLPPQITEGAVSQGVFVYNGKRAENIPPAPWRLLEFMGNKSESDCEEAYQYAINEHDKDSTPGAINGMIFKANQALLEVQYPKQLSKPKNVRKIVWV